jgi:hypothetical protein
MSVHLLGQRALILQLRSPDTKVSFHRTLYCTATSLDLGAVSGRSAGGLVPLPLSSCPSPQTPNRTNTPQSQLERQRNEWNLNVYETAPRWKLSDQTLERLEKGERLEYWTDLLDDDLNVIEEIVFMDEMFKRFFNIDEDTDFPPCELPEPRGTRHVFVTTGALIRFYRRLDKATLNELARELELV